MGGCNSGVEYLLPKQNVVGSNPITRSNANGVICRVADPLHVARRTHTKTGLKAPDRVWVI